MRRPEWIKDESELVECLIQIRDVGVWDMRLRRLAIAPLEDLARMICPTDLHNDQQRLVARTLELAIPRIPRRDFHQAAFILFDVAVESRTPSSTKRREKAARELHQGYATFRDPEKGFERILLRCVAEEIQRLAAESKTHAASSPISWYEQSGVLPEDIMIARNLFHVARTLETRKRHASMETVSEIDDLLKRYAAWHITKGENGYTLLMSFDALCRKYLGLSVFGLLGKLDSRSPGPENPPHQMAYGLTYPAGQSLSWIPGGRDAFSGAFVEPVYNVCLPSHNFRMERLSAQIRMAVYVTAMEAAHSRPVRLQLWWDR